MSMMVGEAVESAAEGGATGKAGLTGGQKATAFTKALPKPKTHHPYIVGLSLIVVGTGMLVGSITGTFPSMLAALFAPSALVDKSGSTPGGILGDIASGITDVVTGGVL